jgi:RNA polymerase sigma factor (sigma-70 family)
MPEHSTASVSISTRPALTFALVQRAAGQDPRAEEDLCLALEPAIQPVAARLLRGCRAHGHDARWEVEDLLNEVLMFLAEDRWHRLRQWDPARGAGLQGFVAVLARNRIIGILRSRRQNPSLEQPVDDKEIERQREIEGSVEDVFGDAERRALLLDAVEHGLGVKDAQLFRWFYDLELSAEQVCELTGRSRAQVYNDKHRLQERLKAVVGTALRELLGSPRSTLDGEP